MLSISNKFKKVFWEVVNLKSLGISFQKKETVMFYFYTYFFFYFVTVHSVHQRLFIYSRRYLNKTYMTPVLWILTNLKWMYSIKKTIRVTFKKHSDFFLSSVLFKIHLSRLNFILLKSLDCTKWQTTMALLYALKIYSDRILWLFNFRGIKINASYIEIQTIL